MVMAVVMAWRVYWGRWEGVRMRVRGVRCRKRRAGSAWEEGSVRRSLSRVISAEAWEAIARVSRWTSRGSLGEEELAVGGVEKVGDEREFGEEVVNL